jgi:ABC-2 type transport system ATP-binding protein
VSDAVAIRTSGLGKRYASRWALRDCTREISSGSVTALVGPNGAGKTTLLHMVIGLIEPTSGVVEVFGRSPRRDAKEVLPRLGFVAQDHPLHRNLTIAESSRMDASSTRAGTSGSRPSGSSVSAFPRSRRSVSCPAASRHRSR